MQGNRRPRRITRQTDIDLTDDDGAGDPGARKRARVSGALRHGSANHRLERGRLGRLGGFTLFLFLWPALPQLLVQDREREPYSERLASQYRALSCSLPSAEGARIRRFACEAFLGGPAYPSWLGIYPGSSVATVQKYTQRKLGHCARLSARYSRAVLVKRSGTSPGHVPRCPICPVCHRAAPL